MHVNDHFYTFKNKVTSKGNETAKILWIKTALAVNVNWKHDFCHKLFNDVLHKVLRVASELTVINLSKRCA